MLDVVEESLAPTVERWLADFDQAISALDPGALEGLFVQDSHWRDLVAFSWHIQTVSGAGKIVDALKDLAPAAKPAGFRIDPRRTPPRVITRAGRETVEAIFGFETAYGPASGLVRLIRNGEGGEVPKAWTLMTSLDGIRGFEETVGDARPTGEVYSRDFSGPNWLDRRRASAAYDGRDPAVLVVGAGQAGLSIAARLRQWNVDTLVVDRGERVGDNWRGRYHALTLHNQVHVNHLPYMPYPPTWPRYIPKDMIGNWFESYAEAMELNVWTGTEFLGGTYDAGAGVWSVDVRRADGTTRTMRPRHVVMATGVSGIPSIPHIPSLENYAGPVLHSTQYEEAADWAGRNVVVIGSGTSGHDICQDLHSHGAHVTMVQRSPTTVVQVEPSAQLPYALYDEGPDLEDCDFIVTATPFALLKKSHQIMTAQCKALDKDLLDRLTKAGFRIDEDDDTGWQFKYLTRGGGYYFNVGCSDLIADGEVGLVQYDDIDAFVADGVRMRNGETLPADLIILATGYKNQDYLVGQLFGAEVAERVGPIWGFDPVEQELRNMWVRTAQPGLWFIAGSFAQCRIYSKYLGLQIKACEEGMISAVR